MTNQTQTKPATTPRELTAAEMRQAGGGADRAARNSLAFVQLSAGVPDC